MPTAHTSVSVGSPAPEIRLTDQTGREWRLSDHRGNVVVLLFYPQNETLVCTRQLCSLRDNWEKYAETKAEIVGISPGQPEENQNFWAKLALPVKLLSDPGRSATTLYAKHRWYPINFTRGIVIVDADGVIRDRDIMLRAFRPKDDELITEIYAARGDALQQTYAALKLRTR